MSGLIDDLIDNISSQTKKYQELLNLLSNKNKAVISADIEELNKLTFNEQVLIGAVQKLEKSRLVIIKDMSIVLGEDPEQLTLSKLIAFLEKQPEEAQRLEAVSNELKDVLNSVKQLNEQNSVLLKNAIEYVDFSINVLRSSHTVEVPTYPDKNSNAGRYSMFDAKQ